MTFLTVILVQHEYLIMFILFIDLQQVAQNLNSQTVSVRAVLDQESRLWLSGIYRRLAGRVGIPKPYYAEITRSIPHSVFLSMRQVLRDLNVAEPNCYFAGNKKADVISITNMEIVHKLLSCLSGHTIAEVKKYFERTHRYDQIQPQGKSNNINL